jgi:hypothetical protein
MLRRRKKHTSTATNEDIFWGAINSVFIFLVSFYTPLHVSALMGYLQVEHTQSLMEAIALQQIHFKLYNLFIYSFSILLCYTL